MINLTDKAKKTLDDYLEQVKISLLGCKCVDADEVQKDVLDHIERELEEAKQPICVGDVEQVLQHLGSPQQWVPDEEISWYEKIIIRLRKGPDDWRLAYLSLGLLILTFVFPPLFLFSFLLSRAAVALARKRCESLGPQKWLIYPSLLVLYVPFATLFLSWPVYSLHAMPMDKMYAISLLFLAFGFWWLVLGVFFRYFPQALEFLIAPFADNIANKIAKILIAAFIITLILSAAVFSLFLFVANLK